MRESNQSGASPHTHTHTYALARGETDSLNASGLAATLRLDRVAAGGAAGVVRVEERPVALAVETERLEGGAGVGQVPADLRAVGGVGVEGDVVDLEVVLVAWGGLVADGGGQVVDRRVVGRAHAGRVCTGKAGSGV